MSRNIQRSIYAALSIAVAVVLFCHADTCTDEELRHDVLEFLTTRDRWCRVILDGETLQWAHPLW